MSPSLPHTALAREGTRVKNLDGEVEFVFSGSFFLLLLNTEVILPRGEVIFLA